MHTFIFEKVNALFDGSRAALCAAPGSRARSIPDRTFAARFCLTLRRFLLKAKSFVFCNCYKYCLSLSGKSIVNQVLRQC